MVSPTVVDSVERWNGPPEDVDRLEAELVALRLRFPGVILQRYGAAIPKIDENVYIAPGAALIGDVHLQAESSVWYGCVLRGDVNRIVLGRRSNIQDGSVVHLGDRNPTIVEDDVVVGHRVVLHACHVESGCLIGIQSTVLDGVRVGHGSVIGAGAVVTAGTEIPPHSLVLGVPARVVKTLDPGAEDFHRKLAAKYCRLAHNYRVG